jgi:hypothetical protein
MPKCALEFAVLSADQSQRIDFHNFEPNICLLDLMLDGVTVYFDLTCNMPRGGLEREDLFGRKVRFPNLCRCREYNMGYTAIPTSRAQALILLSREYDTIQTDDRRHRTRHIKAKKVKMTQECSRLQQTALSNECMIVSGTNTGSIAHHAFYSRVHDPRVNKQH